MFPSLIPPSPSSPLPALDWTPASRVRLQTRVPRQSVHERKIFVIRTRPKLVSVPNKPSNFSVRSSLRGLQFLVTRRRPPPPSPVPSIVRFSSPFPYSSFFPDLTSPTRFTRAPTLNTGPPAIVTRRERQKVSRIDPARKKLFPLFFSFYSSNPPPLSLSPLFSPLRHQFFFLPPFSTPLTFAPSQLSSSARSFPIHHSFRPPVIADFYPRLHRSNPSLLFPLPLLAPSALCSCVSMQSRPRIPRFLPTGYRSPRTGRSKQRNDAPSPPLLLPPFAELSVDRRFFAQLRGNRGYNIK